MWFFVGLGFAGDPNRLRKEAFRWAGHNAGYGMIIYELWQDYTWRKEGKCSTPGAKALVNQVNQGE